MHDARAKENWQVRAADAARVPFKNASQCFEYALGVSFLLQRMS
jgi:hypothetical protein